jgi:hypothetical protein
VRDRLRVFTLVLLGIVVGLPGCLLLLLSAVRLAYASPLLQPAIGFAYWHAPPLQAMWPYLPGRPGWLAILTNAPVMLGVLLVVIGGWIINYARVYHADVAAVEETLRRAQLEDRKGGGNRRQSIGDIFAGERATVNVEQRMVEAARHKRHDLDNGFWEKPLWAVATGAVAIILAAIIMNYVGITQ